MEDEEDTSKKKISDIGIPLACSWTAKQYASLDKSRPCNNKIYTHEEKEGKEENVSYGSELRSVYDKILLKDISNEGILVPPVKRCASCINCSNCKKKKLPS